jgi:sporulation protein YlmC with PRC-barrel domain
LLIFQQIRSLLKSGSRKATLEVEEVTTMDVPVNADVICADGPCGHSTCVIVNPATRKITHLVVKEKGFPYIERLVPLSEVVEAGHHMVRLKCPRDKLGAMDPFIEIEFIPGAGPYSSYEADEYMMWPHVLPLATVPLEHQRIPPDELAVRRGARVEATDGLVGKVDEFLVDPASGHITHLVLREGHLWGKKDVTIPVSEIDRIEEDTVHLKLDKQAVETMPAVPMRKRSRGIEGEH